MSKVFPFERRVEFCETDAAGIAHFSSLIVYMEQAEHALLRSLGLSVASGLTSQPHSNPTANYSWPRVKVECDFHAPAKFEDIVLVLTSIEKLGTKSLTFQHRLTIGNTTIASGKMTSVCCTVQNGALVGIPIPTNVCDLLRPFVI
jgi:acyl-CoA thioester hydrolase